MEDNQNPVEFDLPRNQSSVIKVIGVGGGGSNAVNYMFEQGIKGVDFVICNTDAQALDASSIPNKIQLGITLTEGLGAGANPEIGEQAAQESLAEIERILEKNTKMVFITAGMGGGTGTGAAPIIAKVAKEMEILTVGIVTSPFCFEGDMRNKQAQEGVDRLRNQVDSLIVINNNKLREVYGNLGYKAGFSKADEVLATAARGIAEVITHHFSTNIDLHNARTVLANSGTAIMGSGSSSGENRAEAAIQDALNSPLLNDNHIKGARNVLLLIISGTEEITIDEIGEINEYVQREAGGNTNIILGIGEDEQLGDAIGVTIIATGFAPDQEERVREGNTKTRIVHPLEDEQTIEKEVYSRESQIDIEESPAASTNAKPLTETPLANELGFSPVRGKDRAVAQEQTRLHLDEEETKASREIHSIEDPLPQDESQEESTKTVDEDPFSGAGFTFVLKDEEENEQLPEDLTNAQAKEEALFSDMPSQPISSSDHSRSASPPSSQAKETEEHKEVKQVFVLEDLEELSARLDGEEKKSPKFSSSEEPELKMERREVEAPQPETSGPGGIDNPFERPIDSLAQQRAQDRVARLQPFNHKFRKNSSIEEVEGVPAYKRQGLNIDSEERLSKQETTGKMSVDEEGLRSNNRFLHDNVD